MKKVIIFTVLFGVFNMYSQENNIESNSFLKEDKNEIRLGVIKALGVGVIEVGYEYLYDKNQGFGAYVLVHTNVGGSDYFEELSFNPYYRFYFSKSKEYPARGFFAEGFLNVYGSTGERYLYSPKVSVDKVKLEKYVNAAIGLAIGQKWVNSLGFVLEVKLGCGRDLFSVNPDRHLPIIFKGDVSIGYRF